MSALILRKWTRLRDRWKGEPRTAGTPFRRSDLADRDIAVTTLANLFAEKPTLKALATTTVRLAAERSSKWSKTASQKSSPFEECISFVAKLAELSEERPSQVARAVTSFSKVLLEIKAMTSKNKTQKEVEMAVINAISRVRSECHLPSWGELLPENGISAAIDAGLSAGMTVFGILKEASEAVPVPMLKPIFASVAVLLQAAHQTKMNREEMALLAATTTEFALTLAESCPLSNLPQAFKETIISLEKKLQEVAGGCRELSNQNIGWAFFQNVNHKEKLSGWRRDLNDLFRKLQSLGIMTVIVKQEILEDKVDAARLDSLPRHPSLAQTRTIEYLPNSRPDDERLICDWIARSSELFLWIHAVTGMGKSTLARYIGEKLWQADRLAATLFFGCIPSDEDPHFIVELIAAELGRAHPGATRKVADATSRFRAPSCTLQEKINKLILEPLRHLQYAQPLIVIMDGIDAWNHRASLLKELANLNDEYHLLKFVVTSRSVPDATEISKLSIRYHPLPPVPTTILAKYLETEFEKIDWEDGEGPRSYEVAKLAKMASGLFIWVGTACAIIRHSAHNDDPRTALDHILGSHIAVGVGDALGQLYCSVINHAFPDERQGYDLRVYLQAAFALESPLPIADFARLIHSKRYTVKRIRSKLSCLPRNFDEDDDMVYPALHLFHTSVVEYFRSLKDEFLPPRDGHALLARGCLEVLFELHSLPFDPNFTLTHRPLPLYVALHWTRHLTNSYDPCRLTPGLSNGCDHGVEEIRASLQCYGVAELNHWAHILLRHLRHVRSAKKDQYNTGEIALLMRDVATSLDNSWQYAGSVDARTRAIIVNQQEACSLIAVAFQRGDPDYWHDLGKAHMVMAEHEVASIRPVNNAVAAHEHAVKVMSERPDSDKARYLSSLALSLTSRAEHTGRTEDLANATDYFRKALLLHPPKDRDRHITATGLARCLRRTWERSRERDDLDECIAKCKEALAFLPSNAPEQGATIMTLAEALCTRYAEVDSNPADLEECIGWSTKALRLSDGKRPHLAQTMICLGIARRMRFNLNGDVGELHSSIGLFREALKRIPLGHPFREGTVRRLCTSLYDLQLAGLKCSRADVEETIQLAEEAVTVAPSVYVPILHASHRKIYYEYQDPGANSLENLDAAIELARQMLSKPVGEDERATVSLQLGEDLRMQFLNVKDVTALDESIELCRKALSDFPEGPSHFSAAVNLSLGLRARSVLQERREDLREAISTLEAVSNHCPEEDESHGAIESALKDCYFLEAFYSTTGAAPSASPLG